MDPVTGARTLLNDFGVGLNQGIDPVGVAVESSGQILVVDPFGGTNFHGALFRVDPVTGARTISERLRCWSQSRSTNNGCRR